MSPEEKAEEILRAEKPLHEEIYEAIRKRFISKLTCGQGLDEPWWDWLATWLKMKLRASEEARERDEAGQILAEAYPRPVGAEDIDRRIVDLARQAVREREALREALGEFWEHWQSKEVQAAFTNDWIHGGRVSQECCDRAESVKRKVRAALAGAPQ